MDTACLLLSSETSLDAVFSIFQQVNPPAVYFFEGGQLIGMLNKADVINGISSSAKLIERSRIWAHQTSDVFHRLVDRVL